jgi:hypothetical protein
MKLKCEKCGCKVNKNRIDISIINQPFTIIKENIESIAGIFCKKCVSIQLKNIFQQIGVPGLNFGNQNDYNQKLQEFNRIIK